MFAYRWVARYKTGAQSIVLVLALIGFLVLVVQPRAASILTYARDMYQGIYGDVTGLYFHSGNTPVYAAQLSLQDLKSLLVSGSPALQITALQALGDRADYAVIPHLVKLLNSASSLSPDDTTAPISLAQLSKECLVRIVSGRMVRDPTNVALLIPFFSSAADGTVMERKAVIEILGDTREPLAVPLLERIADKDRELTLRQAARASLAKIRSQDVEIKGYRELQANQVQILVAMTSMVILLLGSMLAGLRKGTDRRFVLLLLVPALVCGGFAWIAGAACWRGSIQTQSIDDMISRGDVVALRIMNYEEYTIFSWDSYVARRLVTLGNEQVIRAVTRVTTLEPDDFDYLKNTVNVRSQWILSRIVASRLGTPDFDRLLKSTDPHVRLTVATMLGRLMIRNTQITRALEALQGDSDEAVRSKAAEAIRQVRQYPEWSHARLADGPGL